MIWVLVLIAILCRKKNQKILRISFRAIWNVHPEQKELTPFIEFDFRHSWYFHYSLKFSITQPFLPPAKYLIELSLENYHSCQEAVDLMLQGYIINGASYNIYSVKVYISYLKSLSYIMSAIILNISPWKKLSYT